MKKNILVIAIFIILSANVNYTSANDCGFVISYTEWAFASLDNWEYEHILPKAAMSQAMSNLKSFCCNPSVFKKQAENKFCTTDSMIDDKWIYPSSTYLYDHILDVSMRRLDAKQENDNWLDLIYGLEPDPTGKIWREFITKQANSKDGSVPLLIKSKFKENREADINSLVWWSSNKGRNNMPRKKETFEKYTERNLADKYRWVCEISIYLYLSLPVDTDNIDLPKLYSAYKSCENLSNERFKKEFNYTKSILMQKGNRLLFNNVKTYLDTYFSQDKMVALQQLVFNIKNTFNEINKAVKELVSPCS